MNAKYTRVDRPNILGDEWTALDNAEYSGKIGAVCGTVRPGTLGYQQCWRIAEHDDAHISQDRIAWLELPEEAP